MTPPSSSKRKAKDSRAAAAAAKKGKGADAKDAEAEREAYMAEVQRLRREVRQMEDELNDLEAADGDGAAPADMSSIMCVESCQ